MYHIVGYPNVEGVFGGQKGDCTRHKSYRMDQLVPPFRVFLYLWDHGVPRSCVVAHGTKMCPFWLLESISGPLLWPSGPNP